MVVGTWLEADAVLAKATAPVTPEQLSLAASAGLDIAEDTPSIVAGATLRVALSPLLGMQPARLPNESSTEWIEAMWSGGDPPPDPDTEDEASAWVEYLFLMRRRESLRALRLNAGDLLVLPEGLFAELSSIGENGRLHFKDGRGFGAWPDQVPLFARADDESPVAEDARNAARNETARRNPAREWSWARQQDLAEFEVPGGATASDIALLEQVIGAAKDERPIQRHLEANPQLLTALMRSGHRFVISQKRLGSEFIPDFAVADVDSIGIHWRLVELESPRAVMYLTDGMTLGAQVRKGVDQVVQWRNWLAGNVAYARGTRRDNGLGLYDIREKTRALVLVGGRLRLDQRNDAARQELRQSSNIEVHTYDWLLETLRSAVSFQGPPAFNPYLLRGDD